MQIKAQINPLGLLFTFTSWPDFFKDAHAFGLEIFLLESHLEIRLKALGSLSETIERLSSESEGELTADLEYLISEFAAELPKKVDEAKLSLEKLSHYEIFWRNQARPFLSIARNCKYAHERISKLMKEMLTRKESLRGEAFEYYLSEGIETVEIVDPEAIPDEFTQRVPRLDEIKGALKKGIEVPGARLLKGKAMRSRMIKNRKELKDGISKSHAEKS